MLYQRYHIDTDIEKVGGFFVPSTNEIVVIVKIDPVQGIDYSLQYADPRSTIEHELVHAFDHTNKDSRASKQDSLPDIGQNFLSACAYLGCLSRSDVARILGSEMLTGGIVSSCIYSISIVLYRLFTITEFNAHQVSDLDETHKVDIKRSEKFRKALENDIVNELDAVGPHLKKSVYIDADDNPELWRLVGRVLNYLGYKVNANSPSTVFNFYRRTAGKLYQKFFNKKMKNQAKAIISLREKNNIKLKLADCIDRGTLEKGISIWFSPTGMSDSFLCRISARNSKLSITVNNKPIKIIGNADGMLKRALDATDNGRESQFEFAVDNLVDVIVQSIERNFNNVGYDPVYDITEPQDEDQAYKSNKVNRFADLD